jgi:hypothetical protein
MEYSVNSEILSTMMNNTSLLLSNPEIFTIVITVIIAMIAKFYLGTSDTKSFSQIIIETVFWIIIGFIIISNSLKYLFGIEIVTKLSDVLTNNPLIEIEIKDKSETPKKKVRIADKNEVFHISGNDYRYQDAEPLCKAYGARVASYDEIESAYQNGGEWCEYGWSKDQMAFFPTQKDTWNELQESEHSKNSCGRPGVNGGYIENPNVRFGVNCYGVKPDITKKEKCLMDNTSYYETPEEKRVEKKSQYWESRVADLIISPFNQNKWKRV